MKVVIAGCRDYADYNEAKCFIDECLLNINEDIVILSGCANGADKLGERYAVENNLGIERYPAQWERFGRAAGPIRNKTMVENSDLIICFWDSKSRGTKSLLSLAEKYNKTIKIKYI
jgi:hypothetical protein